MDRQAATSLTPSICHFPTLRSFPQTPVSSDKFPQEPKRDMKHFPKTPREMGQVLRGQLFVPLNTDTKYIITVYQGLSFSLGGCAVAQFTNCADHTIVKQSNAKQSLPQPARKHPQECEKFLLDPKCALNFPQTIRTRQVSPRQLCSFSKTPGPRKVSSRLHLFDKFPQDTKCAGQCIRAPILCSARKVHQESGKIFF